MTPIKSGQKLVFIGDSITDCGRARPIGEGAAALGTGYVMLADALLTAGHPGLRARVVNMGISGNTIRDLDARWKTDVLDLRPDWLSILIGINDVWRQFDAPLRPEIHVLPEEYSQTLERLVSQTKPLLPGGLIIMSPYMLEPNRSEPMRAVMEKYAAIAAETAKKHGCVFVDLFAAFDRLWEHMHPMNIALDRIHPNYAGSMVIAKALLDALEL